ncbi:MAG: hypothetical protein HYY06_15690 [Deltaproteobacteria bacterium]|nr:hypothetical protein [Deltaproteobacteria bacterium]
MRVALPLALLAAACGGDDGDAPGEPMAVALWSEFMSDDEVRERLPLLADEGADLYLAVQSTRIGDAALEELLQGASEAGVGVRAWLLLPEADGYWPNETNLEAMREAAMAFADWREAAGLPVEWMVFDMEMSLERTRDIAATMEEEGVLAGLQRILDGRDPAAFEAHRAELVALVGDLQARGLKVMCVTYPTVLDDPTDGDEDIQDEMDVPIAGVPWDEASFMVYQSLIYDLSGSWHGPDVIESYAASAREQFDDRAAVALGIVGETGIDPVEMPYPDAETLLADHAAARAAGISTVSIYSLDGVALQHDPGEWIDARVEAAQAPAGDAESLRDLIGSLLDADS